MTTSIWDNAVMQATQQQEQLLQQENVPDDGHDEWQQRRRILVQHLLNRFVFQCLIPVIITILGLLLWLSNFR